MPDSTIDSSTIPAGRHPAAPVLVFVGGGPRTTGLLERMAANAPELFPGDRPAEIHVIDPYPVGGGRIWRSRQSPLLWMNSTAADVTVFTDESVTCEGPIVPGPSLAEWIGGPGRPILKAAGLGRYLGLQPDDFAPREVQAHYLAWAFDRAVAALPAGTVVFRHTGTAVAVTDTGATGATGATGQQVRLADGTTVIADVVVLAQGYLERSLTTSDAALAVHADRHALTYLAPGHTADLDLGDLRPGETVLVRGLGLAFIDLMVLLGEGRGGSFTDNPDGSLTYHPSGREPVLFAGSRRGVPYHAKLGYALAAGGPAPLRYFTSDRFASGPGTLDFRTTVWPLAAKELTAAHYERLFTAHPDRTSVDWGEFLAVLDTADVADDSFENYVSTVVPDPADRFDIRRIDRPLADRPFVDIRDVEAAVAEHVSADLARRADRRYSPDRAVFDRLLSVYAVLAALVTSGRIGPADRIRYVEGYFHGLFSFLASGPPPRRLAELLALHRAGLVRFLGPDLQVHAAENRFVAISPAVPGQVHSRALVDARLPRPDVSAATDPVIRGLLADGELAAEELGVDSDGLPLGGGQLLADSTCRAVRADRSVHPSRFLLGPSVSGSAGSAGFARPGFNSPGFRQNDAVAREVLKELAATGRRNAARPAPGRHDKALVSAV